jgi:O-antigen/teichoic acid export membrane protein
VFGALLLKLLTNGLGADGYGRLALLLTLTGLSAQVLFGPLSQASFRYTAESSVWADHSVARSLSRSALGVVLCASILVLLGTQWWGYGSSVSQAIVAALLAGGFEGYFLVQTLGLASLERFGSAAAMRGLYSLLRLLAIGSVWISLGGISLSSAISALALANAVSAWVADQNLARKEAGCQPKEGQSEGERVSRARFLTYALPFFVWAIPSWIEGAAARWTLTASLSLQSVGVFFALSQLAQLAAGLAGEIVRHVSGPELFRSAKTAAGSVDMRAPFNRFAVLSTAIFVVVALGHRMVATLLTSPEIGEFSGILPVLILGALLHEAGRIGALQGMALQKPEAYLLPKLSFAPLSLLLYFLLGSQYGLFGAAGASVLLGFTYLVWILGIGSRLTARVGEC